MDVVLKGIIDRAMKRMALEHARESGAQKDWLALADNLDAKTAWAIVSVLYGEPDWNK